MSDTVQEIPIKDISPSAHNRRGRVSKTDPAVLGLAESIRASGLLHPVTVRPSSGTGGRPYQLLAGERRLVACQVLKQKTIRDNVISACDDAQAQMITVTENLQREALPALAEALSIRDMLRSGRAASTLSAECGKSVAWILRRAKLCDLIPVIQERVTDAESSWSRLPIAHLEAIARRVPERQQAILDDYQEFAPIDQSAEELERVLRAQERLLSSAAWDLAALDCVDVSGATLPACTGCSKRSDAIPELFHDDAAEASSCARCLDEVCWRAKMASTNRAEIAAQQAKHGDRLLVVGCDDSRACGVDVQVADYQVARAKKTEEGAVPALMVSGDRPPKLEWVRPLTRPKAPGTPASSLEKLRMGWVCRYVAKVVKNLTTCPDAFNGANLLAVIAQFGTASVDDYAGTTTGAWDRVRATWLTVNEDLVRNQVWEAMKPVLLMRLKYFSVDQCSTQYREAIEQASILFIATEEELSAMAIESVPDGTRKRGRPALSKSEQSA